ncbi:tsl2131 [Thermosynechococcus vestitus BP-1]|uniref:Tsl2131 protein n=1 Tax=Thermosynechococcus vestitus (strain NIES-2133 / IAM M-273 / BP-1) TaxID=197221 RepID=Q8DH29_THEVB|nr:tsl2131 [Thermosynechococcus vestitus BP-1]
MTCTAVVTKRAERGSSLFDIMMVKPLKRDLVKMVSYRRYKALVMNRRATVLWND